jgi:hypothetical protein
MNTHPDYENLPESIKMAVSEKEFCWLSELEKQQLQDDFCMPQVEE